MSKFTPGPWQVYESYNCDGDPRTAVKGRIHSPYDYRVIFADGEGDLKDADASLIAAAPDLYDAACNALDTFLACVVPAGGVDDQKSILDAGTMLMAAIAKAEGKQ